MMRCLQKRMQYLKQLFNNKGVTMAEMLVTFILLGIFLVAATRVISYTIGIYYLSKGNINGYQVSSIIYDKVAGEIENAIGQNPTVSSNNSIRVENKNNNVINIGLTEEDSEGRKYLRIIYEPTTYQGATYNEVDWKYDSKVYLGYSIDKLVFEDPNKDSEGNEITDSEGNPYYAPNVVRMELVVKSPRYGAFESNYYIKCFEVDKVEFK